ncbi:MAG: hypothetical protein QNJ27_05805 [Simkaniaceae bacterium]|nr:hypothetical protein [Simkaniaceae bacterium]
MPILYNPIDLTTLDYNNGTSGLTADKAEAAIDEINGKVNLNANEITTLIGSIAQPLGIASLGSDGKIPSAQISSIAITSVNVVADIAARDALTVEIGDVAKVTDSDGNGNPSTYIYDSTAWIDIQETSDVISVNGQTQTVVLGAADINAVLTPAAYTAATADIEAHLTGIDSSLASLAASTSNIAYFNAEPNNGLATLPPGDATGLGSIAIGFGDAEGAGSISIGTGGVAGSAFDGIAIGNRSVIGEGASNAVQLGTGTNNTASSLQFLSNRLANAEGLYTSHIATNYAPADADNVTSHFEAIDTRLGTCELKLVINAEQSANFTATVGNLEPVDCTSAAITVTPPAAPSPGDRFAVVDSRANSATNNIIVDFASAGQNFYGTTDTFGFNEDGAYVTFKYLSAVIGWVADK